MNFLHEGHDDMMTSSGQEPEYEPDKSERTAPVLEVVI